MSLLNVTEFVHFNIIILCFVNCTLMKKRKKDNSLLVHGDTTEARSRVRLKTGRLRSLAVQWAVTADSERWKDPVVLDDNDKM